MPWKLFKAVGSRSEPLDGLEADGLLLWEDDTAVLLGGVAADVGAQLPLVALVAPDTPAPRRLRAQLPRGEACQAPQPHQRRPKPGASRHRISGRFS